MKRLTTCLLGASLALLLAGSANAQDFAYGVTGTSSVPGSGGGSIVLTAGGNQEGVTCSEPGGSNITLASLETFSGAAAGDPETVADGDYDLTLTIRDLNTGLEGVLTFSGTMSGTFSSSTANIDNTFTPPTDQTITVGDTVYRVQTFENSFTPPGPPGSQTPGAIAVNVTCGPDTVIPEPGTMALLGLGVLPMVGAIRRRIRK